MPIIKIISIAALLWGARPARAQEEAKASRYAPPTRSFYCDVPSGWHAFEEEDALGNVVHLLGPDSPSGNYRTGIDIRWVEKSQPGFRPVAKAIDEMRGSDPMTERTATGARPMRISGILSRTFEIQETRRLAPDSLPSLEEELHHYVAVIPSGESYYVIRLSSTRDVYLDYRKLFVDFLRSFKTANFR